MLRAIDAGVVRLRNDVYWTVAVKLGGRFWVVMDRPLEEWADYGPEPVVLQRVRFTARLHEMGTGKP